MKYLLKYYKPYIPLILVIIVTTFGQVLFELKLPEYMAKIIDEGVLTGNLSAIKELGVLMIAFAFVASLCSAIGVVFTSVTASGTVRKIRSDLFSKITSLGSREFDRFSASSLITRSTNDMQQLQQATVMMLRTVIFAPIVGIGALIMAIKTSLKLSWTIGAAIICVLAVMMITYLAVLPRFRAMQIKIDKINMLLRERLSGIFVIRGFRLEREEEEKFDDVNDDLTKQFVSVNRHLAFMSPSINLIVSLAGILIVWIGTHMIEGNNLQVGDMMAYIQYATQVILSFKYVTSIFNMIPRAAVSAERIGEVLSEEPSLIENQSCMTYLEDNAKATVVFNKVSFAYPDSHGDSLREVSFVAEPGTVTAIIGGTGSGKSTLASMIPRLIDPTEGVVTINGTDVKEMGLNELRKHVGMVPQESRLFSGTIGTNLKFANEAVSDETMKEVAEISQIREFIDGDTAGFNREITHLGRNLSGGQKQRMTIARMIAGDPEIMIFDDSFSALDFATEKKLRQSIKRRFSEKTIIIITQRISTAMDADNILVLDDGKVAGEGTHEELLGSCSIYGEIAESQLSRKKLKIQGRYD